MGRGARLVPIARGKNSGEEDLEIILGFGKIRNIVLILLSRVAWELCQVM